MKQNSTETPTHTHTPKQILAPTRTGTHIHTYTLVHWCVFKELSVFVCSQIRIWFALHYAPKHARIHKSLSAYVEREMPHTHKNTHKHTHARTQSHTCGDRHSSHKQLSRNHNKFTSAAQMFDKKFLKSFHWFRNVSTISMPRPGGGRGCVLAIDIYGPRCYRVDIS